MHTRDTRQRRSRLNIFWPPNSSTVTLTFSIISRDKRAGSKRCIFLRGELCNLEQPNRYRLCTIELPSIASHRISFHSGYSVFDVCWCVHLWEVMKFMCYIVGYRDQQTRAARWRERETDAIEVLFNLIHFFLTIGPLEVT